MKRTIEAAVCSYTIFLVLVAVWGCGGGQPSAAAQPDDNPLLKQADEAFSNQNWKQAAELYAKLTEQNDQDARSWMRLGYALHADRQLEAAIKAHQQASRFPPVKAVSLYNLACAYALTEQPKKALEALQQALDAGFTSPQPIDADPDLASLVDDPKFQELKQQAVPLSQSDLYRAFDFWVGSWDVYSPSGQQVGTNVISKSDNGFVLTEKWTSASGGTGTSINFVDPNDQQWKQIWVDASGGVLRYSGNVKDGVMQMEGLSVSARGVKRLSRMSFTPQDDGSVRQFIEHSSDNGETWTVYFDGKYVRQKE